MATYRLYIDESGTHSYSLSQKADKRFLALTGIAVRSDLIESELQPRIRKLKAIISPDPDVHFTLHREEIKDRTGIYTQLANPDLEARWNSEIFSIVDGLDFTIFTVVIDKIKHKTEYYAPKHPYHYCLEIILERYVKFLSVVDGKGDVIAEARGKNEDQQLMAEYKRFFDTGTSFMEPEVIQARLTSSKLKVKCKDSIAGLELADLLVLASKLDVMMVNSKADSINSKFMQQLIPRMQAKYYRNLSSGKIEGYGKKMI